MKARNYKSAFLSAAKIISLIIFIFSVPSLVAQQKEIDSLKQAINTSKKDTAKIDLYEKLGDAYRSERKMDSSVLSYRYALEINEKNNDSW